MKVMLAALVLALVLQPAMASEAFSGGPAAEQPLQDGYTLPSGLRPDQVLELPPVTVDDLGERLSEKGEDVVWLIQVVGRYICLGMFVVCCVLTVMGMVGNHRSLPSALLGAIFSGICYGAITCGEQIVQAISAWIAS